MKTINEIKQMSRSERYEINKTRRYDVLNFLADGEYFTTAENIRILLNVNNITYSRRILGSMCEDKLLTKTPLSFGGKARNFYSINQNGFIFLGVEDETRIIKLSHLTAYHNELVQRLKIITMQLVNDATWYSEYTIKSEHQLRSYPDALLIVNDKKISIELQRNLYSLKAFKSKIQKVIADSHADKFSKVLYVCCDNLKAAKLKTLLNSVKTIKNSRNEEVALSDEIKSKLFDIIDYDEYRNFIKNLAG